jgi:hypothetical protein
MTVHLLKMAVGIESLSQLKAVQKARLAQARAAGKRPAKLCHYTCYAPKRAEEIVRGGSIYWIIGRQIRARQRIRAIEQATRETGAPCCALVLDRTLVMVEPVNRRPHQGWRYLEASDAPPDLSNPGRAGEITGDLPPDLLAELRALGLL